jgi:glycosyltransferase involved in cell wall biosynthesis
VLYEISGVEIREKAVSEARPMRVMHIIDTLGSGGSERWVWDIVRLSDPKLVKYSVITFFPDGYFGPFVYAERLRQAGVFVSAQGVARKSAALGDTDHQAINDHSTEISSEVSRPAGGLSTARSIPRDSYHSLKAAAGKLPSSLKKPLKSLHYLAFSIRNLFIRWARVYLPASYRILAAYLRFRPDVIHVHGFYPFVYVPLFKSVLRRPVAHTVPSLFSQMIDQGTGWLPGLYRKHHRLVDRFFLAPAFSAELLGIGVPVEKLSHICGAVDFQAVVHAKSESARHRVEVRERLGLPKDALIALSVGRLHPSKGHQYTVEALPMLVEQFPNLHWVVLGEGGDYAALMARARELNVVQHVHLAGFIPDPLPFYTAADIYLRTPVFESENFSSFYAIAMGLPVVGFDTHCETDLIGKVGHGILVTNRDAKALAAATIHVLSLPDRGRQMGQLGTDYSRANLDIQQSIDNFISIYDQLSRNET